MANSNIAEFRTHLNTPKVLFPIICGAITRHISPTMVDHRGNKALATSRFYAAYAAVVWKPRMSSDQDLASVGVMKNMREDRLEKTPT